MSRRSEHISNHRHVIGGTLQVHEASTTAASSAVVTALNEGRDVIFDGTMSWEPFVVQTFAMARDVHRRRYRLGPGYRKLQDGTLVERYWEPVEDEDYPDGPGFTEEKRPKLAYRIEVVGVVCDAHLAVVRGMRSVKFPKRLLCFYSVV